MSGRGLLGVSLDEYNKIKNKTNEIVELELRNNSVYCVYDDLNNN